MFLILTINTTFGEGKRNVHMYLIIIFHIIVFNFKRDKIENYMSQTGFAKWDEIYNHTLEV